jgi:hypothetical protein
VRRLQHLPALTPAILQQAKPQPVQPPATLERAEPQPGQPPATLKRAEAQSVQPPATLKRVEAQSVQPPATLKRAEAQSVRPPATLKRAEAQSVRPPATLIQRRFAPRNDEVGRLAMAGGGFRDGEFFRWTSLPRLAGERVPRQGRERVSFHAERIDADFFAVESGQTSPFFLPLFIQRRSAPDGWKPSPGLRPPSRPPSGGGEESIGRIRHCEERSDVAIQFVPYGRKPSPARAG